MEYGSLLTTSLFVAHLIASFNKFAIGKLLAVIRKFMNISVIFRSVAQNMILLHR